MNEAEATLREMRENETVGTEDKEGAHAQDKSGKDNDIEDKDTEVGRETVETEFLELHMPVLRGQDNGFSIPVPICS